jgi:hypothetical protein
MKAGPAALTTGGVALAAGDRSSAVTEQVTLTTKEVMAEVHLPYDVIEDNIERGNTSAGGPTGTGGPRAGGIQDTILSLIAERAALDLEELALLGDTASGDAYLALQDGFLEQAKDNGVADSTQIDFTANAEGYIPNTSTAYAGTTGTIYDLGEINKELFRKALQAMPTQYLRNRADMKFFLSIDQEINYRNSLGNRVDALGDRMVEGNDAVRAFGVPVEPVALMPAANGLFCDPLNLIMGVQRKLTFEYDKDIRAREFIIVVSSRVAFAIEEVDATIYMKGIGVSA